MKRRMISDEPSKIRLMRKSRMIRSTGTGASPRARSESARLVAAAAADLQRVVDDAASPLRSSTSWRSAASSRMSRSPMSAIAEAQVGDRLHRERVAAISAIICAIASCLPIGWPHCTRSFAQRARRSRGSACRAATDEAGSVSRPVFSVIERELQALALAPEEVLLRDADVREADDAVLDRPQAHEVAADARPRRPASDFSTMNARDLLACPDGVRHDDEAARRSCRWCTRASRRSGSSSRPRACASRSSRGSPDRSRRAPRSARTPRSRPGARRGRYFFFCSSVPNSFSGCGTPIDWCAESSATRLPSRLVTSSIASPYSSCDRPRPPYSFGIFMPKAPSSAQALDDRRRDLALAVDRVRIDLLARKRSSRSMNARNSGRSGGAAGNGMDQVEAEVAEEDLLQEGRGLPLGSRGPPRRPGGPRRR